VASSCACLFFFEELALELFFFSWFSFFFFFFVLLVMLRLGFFSGLQTFVFSTHDALSDYCLSINGLEMTFPEGVNRSSHAFRSCRLSLTTLALSLSRSLFSNHADVGQGKAQTKASTVAFKGLEKGPITEVRGPAASNPPSSRSRKVNHQNEEQGVFREGASSGRHVSGLGVPPEVE
jgi:hypothetical protein